MRAMADVDYAVLVKHLRAVAELSQEQLARELDVTVGTVNGWENSRHRPINAQRKRLRKMAEEQGVAVPRKTGGAR